MIKRRKHEEREREKKGGKTRRVTRSVCFFVGSNVHVAFAFP